MSKLTKQPFSRCIIGTFGFLCCGEITKMLGAFRALYAAVKEGAALIKIHALDTARGSLTWPAVAEVVASTSFAQVIPSVVRLVPVAMIDLSARIVARDKFPDNSMRFVFAIVEADKDIAARFMEYAARRASKPAIPDATRPQVREVRRRSSAPRQDTSSWRVMKAVVQVAMGRQRFGCYHSIFIAESAEMGY